MPHPFSPYGNRPTDHNQNRRAAWNNYSEPGTYLITIVTRDRKPWLGKLETLPEPWIRRSKLGEGILASSVPKITEIYPMVKVWHLCFMPDHIHMILNVESPLPRGKHLGHVISGFKGGCTQLARHILKDDEISLFQQGYNDRVLFKEGQLQGWKRYLSDNPRRLALKRLHPDLFTSIFGVDVLGRECQIIGNRFLLDWPDKEAVVVHRADSEIDYEKKRRDWLACGERGGVIVSAAIAEREKAVMREAMDLGYKVIFLRNNGFPPLYKPAGRAFDACASGQLLQVSPWPYNPEKKSISRQECLVLNSLAEEMAGNTTPR